MKTNKGIHDFHFVLNNNLKSKLFILSKALKLSMSKTLMFILEKANPVAKKLHFLNSPENNKIEKINWNKHIHIYFTKGKLMLYNELKCIHKDLNSYSIAVNLRYVLNVFIRGVELYGLDKFIIILDKSKNKMETIFKKKKIWRKCSVRQLSNKKLLYVQYDSNYLPVLIKLLN